MVIESRERLYLHVHSVDYQQLTGVSTIGVLLNEMCVTAIYFASTGVSTGTDIKRFFCLTDNSPWSRCAQCSRLWRHDCEDRRLRSDQDPAQRRHILPTQVCSECTERITSLLIDYCHRWNLCNILYIKFIIICIAYRSLRRDIT